MITLAFLFLVQADEPIDAPYQESYQFENGNSYSVIIPESRIFTLKDMFKEGIGLGTLDTTALQKKLPDAGGEPIKLYREIDDEYKEIIRELEPKIASLKNEVKSAATQASDATQPSTSPTTTPSVGVPTPQPIVAIPTPPQSWDQFSKCSSDWIDENERWNDHQNFLCWPMLPNPPFALNLFVDPKDFDIFLRDLQTLSADQRSIYFAASYLWFAKDSSQLSNPSAQRFWLLSRVRITDGKTPEQITDEFIQQNNWKKNSRFGENLQQLSATQCQNFFNSMQSAETQLPALKNFRTEGTKLCGT